MKIFPALNFFWQLLRIKVTGRPKPLTVIFNLTNRCNLKCCHCYAAYHERGTGLGLTTGQVKTILTDLKANGCLRISFSGGEPLLRPDLGEILDHAQSLGLSVTVNTNGLLVLEQISILKKVDSLAISLDGRPEHHDRLRGAGVGEKVVAAIQGAAKAGITVHTNTVLNRHNIDDVDYILDLARAYGLKAEFALAIAPVHSGRDRETDLKPDTEAIRQVLRSIIRKKRQGAPILFSAASYESVLKGWDDFSCASMLGQRHPGMPGCPAGRIFGIVDADGTFCACPHLLENRQVPRENILQVGVAKAWATAGQHGCGGCYQVYHHEFALLADLNPAVVWNYARLAFEKRKGS